MDDNDLYLKDWEMAKNHIVHFDDAMIRLRLEGIPIAITVLAIGFAAFHYTQGAKVVALIPLFGALYLFGIWMLDQLHFNLMEESVKLAKQIENMPQYKYRLRITTKLTTSFRTRRHKTVASIIYASVIVLNIIVVGIFLLSN